jgi:hypothetical protein
VEIHESALADTGEDNTFVHPSFLLSQQPQRSSHAARSQLDSSNAERRDSEGDLMSIFQKSTQPTANPLRRSESQLSQTSMDNTAPNGTAAGGLLGSLGRARERTAGAAQLPSTAEARMQLSGPAVTISFGPHSGTSTGNAPTSSSSKPSGGVSFGLGATAKSSTAFHVPQKVVRTKDSTIADYFAAPPAAAVSQPTASQRSQPQLAAKRPALNIPKFDGKGPADSQPAPSSQPQSFLSYLSQLDEDMHSSHADPLSEFHRNIGMEHVLHLPQHCRPPSCACYLTHRCTERGAEQG